ncbi:MAG: phosphotriesterase family protein [Marmoricola sp.]
MTSVVVRTVSGDLHPELLGATDYHEHLFQVTPLLPRDELDDETASRTEAASLRAAGARAMVEATPIGLGRRPSAVARIASTTGLHVIHVTGAHRDAHYAPDHPLLDASTAALTEQFRSELVAGMAEEDGSPAHTPSGEPVRAGVLKGGVDYWRITRFEARVLEAVGGVAAETGAPVMVHLEHGSAAHEVLDALAGHGCPAERVCLAHMDRNPDPRLMLELTSRGALIGFDGPARHHRWPDSVLADCLADVVAGGGGGHVLLGGDVARRTRYHAYGGMPGLAYLFDRFVPRLRGSIGDEALHRILVDNPARWLAW